MIDRKLVEITLNWSMYIAAQENPNNREPETQRKIESLESKYLIKDL